MGGSVACPTLGFGWGDDLTGGGRGSPGRGKLCAQQGICLKDSLLCPSQHTRVLMSVHACAHARSLTLAQILKKIFFKV